MQKKKKAANQVHGKWIGGTLMAVPEAQTTK
jgi:hypothetical protein